MYIEELAFKDRKNLAQLNELDLLDIIEFLQIDRKQWINQFSKTHNESVEIQKENQELKKQNNNFKTSLDESQEIIIDYIKENQELKKQLEVGEQQYNDLVEEKEKLETENQVLKDNKNIALIYMKNYLQMELRYQNKDAVEHFKIVIYLLNRGNKGNSFVDVIDYEPQQKEFIKYLEDEIERKRLNATCTVEYNDYVIPLRKILQKYKEIIGDDK